MWVRAAALLSGSQKENINHFDSFFVFYSGILPLRIAYFEVIKNSFEIDIFYLTSIINKQLIQLKANLFLKYFDLKGFNN